MATVTIIYRHEVEGITTTTDFWYPPRAFIGRPVHLTRAPVEGAVFGINVTDRDQVLPATTLEAWIFTGADTLPLVDAMNADDLPDAVTVHRLKGIIEMPHYIDAERGRLFALGHPFEIDKGPLVVYGGADDGTLQVALRGRDPHTFFASVTALELGIWVA